MRKVGEVLKDIEDLKNCSKIISDIASKMSNDNEVQTYMFETFGVYVDTMNNVANKISLHARRLQNSLEECQVDID